MRWFRRLLGQSSPADDDDLASSSNRDTQYHEDLEQALIELGVSEDTTQQPTVTGQVETDFPRHLEERIHMIRSCLGDGEGIVEGLEKHIDALLLELDSGGWVRLGDRILKETVALEPSELLKKRLVKRLLERGELDTVAIILDELIEANPDDLESLYLQSTAAIQVHHFDRARSSLEKILLRDIHYADALKVYQSLAKSPHKKHLD